MKKACQLCYEYIEKMSETFDVSPDYVHGILLGAALIILLLILIRLLRRVFFGKRKLKGVTVPGSAGNLFVTMHAIRQFIQRILYEFDEVSLSSVTVTQRRGEILFAIDLEVTPDVELVPLRDQIQQRVIEDAERRLGLGLPVKVNLDIRSIQANSRKLSRAEKKEKRQVRKSQPPIAGSRPKTVTVSRPEPQAAPDVDSEESEYPSAEEYERKLEQEKDFSSRPLDQADDESASDRWEESDSSEAESGDGEDEELEIQTENEEETSEEKDEKKQSYDNP